MSSEPKVFISYAHEDYYFVKTLKENIEAQGIYGWLDSEEIRAGKNWQEEIDQAIRRSFALIVVMSPDAKRSPYVTYEWSFALGREIAVIPILHRKTKLHARLQFIEFLDFSQRKHNLRPWEDLYKALKESQEEFTSKKRGAARRADEVIEWLYSNDIDTRLFAATTLGFHRISKAVPSLLEQISDTNEDMRIAVISALGDIGEIAAIPAIIDALQDPAQRVRSEALDAAVKLGKAAVPRLLAQARNKENSLILEGRQSGRINAIMALGRIGEREAIPTVVEALSDNDAIIRGVAADVLGDLKAEVAVPALIKLLEDKEQLSWFYGRKPTRVYKIVAKSLLEIGTFEAKEAVTRMEQSSGINRVKWKEMEWSKVGKVTHYFDRINVAAITLYDDLTTGEQVIFVKDTTLLLEQEVTSIQINHQGVSFASGGDNIGLKVKQEVRKGSAVYKLRQ